ncbi:hypothetical protein EKH77_17440 [Streptomyces luteoverticillatus]|uniref:Uncharacterized protein n=1 Tax=Streptomyces luteoverticillatus TaxID=66425 RepID=A0A3Q9G0J6_STRLT|nr:hypothetical protein EKH77_17440 [Streptomyces luteoverticillatus]
MSPRTTTVRIPRQRRRGRGSDPFVVVVPERLPLSHELLFFLGRTLWAHRRAAVPLLSALSVLVVTAVLHALAWWSGLVLAPVAAAPLVWLVSVQQRYPAGSTSVRAWRVALALLATGALTWIAMAAAFGPLTGPLALWWLVLLIAAQIVWHVARPFLRTEESR